ncbi:hypothetical protein APHAL10511_000486 [Amanita phalloides]|nr:hypothetical protein APHAL10511_000486 [Amanita phalloides]
MAAGLSCPFVSSLPLVDVYSGPHTSEIIGTSSTSSLGFKDAQRHFGPARLGWETLSLLPRKWTEEIMYPASDFFPRLRKLETVNDEDD